MNQMQDLNNITTAINNTPVSMGDMILGVIPIGAFLEGRKEAKEDFYNTYRNVIDEAYKVIEESTKTRKKIGGAQERPKEEPGTEQPPYEPEQPEPEQPTYVPLDRYDDNLQRIIAGFSYPLLASLVTIGYALDQYKDLAKSMERIVKYIQRTPEEIVGVGTKTENNSDVDKNRVPMFV